MIFKNTCILVLWTKLASASEGLMVFPCLTICIYLSFPGRHYVIHTLIFFLFFLDRLAVEDDKVEQRRESREVSPSLSGSQSLPLTQESNSTIDTQSVASYSVFGLLPLEVSTRTKISYNHDKKKIAKSYPN